MDEERRGMTRWDFYGLALKVGLVMFVLVTLFLMARKGEIQAIVILAVIIALALAGLGFGAALLILDRQAQAEQRRFVANLKENMVYLEQQTKVLQSQLAAQGRLDQNLLRQNQMLIRQLPENGDALSWDVEEEQDWA